MAEGTGIQIVRSLQKRWRWQGMAYCLFLAGSASVLLTVILIRITAFSPWYGTLIFLAVFSLILFRIPYWRLSLTDTTRYLDSHLPELEESSNLLCRPGAELGALERLQAERTAAKLLHRHVRPPLQQKMFLAAASLAVAIIVALAFGGKDQGNAQVVTPVRTSSNAIEKPAPGVSAVSIRIIPPAYTGRTTRQQSTMDLRVEEGAVVSWQLEITQPLDSVQFILNDSVTLNLGSANTDRTSWRLSLTARHAGFYQVRTAGRLSGLYRIEVLPDAPPRIMIKTPRAYTIVDLGESKKIPLSVRLEDDYGIGDANIVATIASGSGEAVKFREQKIAFDRSFNGGAVYDLQKLLDLDKMGLKPGDELYFYCRARDNHGQESRTDMYIISLPDTAQLMSLSGMTTGLDIKPELFRSERQIIIETEQLLRAKDTIPEKAFRDRSNDLGIDQKLLRLRYGKFLGEEAEEGGAQEAYDALNAPKDFSNAAKVLDAFTDKHDNSEDAAYFEPAIRAQLKATLTEMWNAELRLRTFRPQEALPFAYKALRLLKDLQQKSRAFVAKTGVKVTPPDPAKRLTGKLDGIVSPEQRGTTRKEQTPAEVQRIALSLLDQLPVTNIRSQASLIILQQSLRQLGSQASAHPAEFLAGYEAMKRIVLEQQAAPGIAATRPGLANDIRLAQQVIKKILPEPEANPSPGKRPADKGLGQLYFTNLNPALQKK